MRVANRAIALAAFALFGVSGLGRAQNIEFKGTTEGCFVAPAESTCSLSSTDVYQALLFSAGSFDVHTVGGEAGIGSATNTLGWFSVGPSFSTDPTSYNGASFLLNVVFALPTIISSPDLFTAAVKGSVQMYNGMAKIVFDESSQAYEFIAGDQKGTFMLNVNNLSLTPGANGPVALTGDIEVTSLTATPEPGTTALLATGLLGLIPVVRSRRRKASALAV